jgi:hypothetical protein
MLSIQILLRINGVKTEGVYDGWDSKREMPVISFHDETGKAYRFTSSYSLGDRVQGDKIPVLYRKNNPEKACTALWGEVFGGILFLVFGVIIALILWFIWFKKYTMLGYKLIFHKVDN